MESKEMDPMLTKEMGTVLPKEMGTVLNKDMGTVLNKEMGTTLTKEMDPMLTKEMGIMLTKDMGTTLTKEMGTMLTKEMGTMLNKEMGIMLTKDMGTTLTKEMDPMLTREMDNADERYIRKKSKLGRKGDPRMHKAVAARMKNPKLSLLDALREGGFDYPEEALSSGTFSDVDNIQLCQRKNQLSRRLRFLKKKNSNSKDKNGSSHDHEISDVGSDTSKAPENLAYRIPKLEEDLTTGESLKHVQQPESSHNLENPLFKTEDGLPRQDQLNESYNIMETNITHGNETNSKKRKVDLPNGNIPTQLPGTYYVNGSFVCLGKQHQTQLQIVNQRNLSRNPINLNYNQSTNQQPFHQLNGFQNCRTAVTPYSVPPHTHSPVNNMKSQSNVQPQQILQPNPLPMSKNNVFEVNNTGNSIQTSQPVVQQQAQDNLQYQQVPEYNSMPINRNNVFEQNNQANDVSAPNPVSQNEPFNLYQGTPTFFQKSAYPNGSQLPALAPNQSYQRTDSTPKFNQPPSTKDISSKMKRALDNFRAEASSLLKRCMLSAGFEGLETDECDPAYIVFATQALYSERNRVLRLRSAQKITWEEFKSVLAGGSRAGTSNETMGSEVALSNGNNGNVGSHRNHTHHGTHGSNHENHTHHGSHRTHGSNHENHTHGIHGSSHKNHIHHGTHGSNHENQIHHGTQGSNQAKENVTNNERTESIQSTHKSNNDSTRGDCAVHNDKLSHSHSSISSEHKCHSNCLDGRHIHRLEGKCGHKAIIHKPENGPAHVDFVVNGKVECYQGIKPLGSTELDALLWPSKFSCDELTCNPKTCNTLKCGKANCDNEAHEVMRNVEPKQLDLSEIDFDGDEFTSCMDLIDEEESTLLGLFKLCSQENNAEEEKPK